jgi:hypothetical protein
MCTEWPHDGLLECNYWSGRYWSMDYTGFGELTLEVRLVRFPGYDAPGEIVDTRTDTWSVP